MWYLFLKEQVLILSASSTVSPVFCAFRVCGRQAHIETLYWMIEHHPRHSFHRKTLFLVRSLRMSCHPFPRSINTQPSSFAISFELMTQSMFRNRTRAALAALCCSVNIIASELNSNKCIGLFLACFCVFGFCFTTCLSPK